MLSIPPCRFYSDHPSDEADRLLAFILSPFSSIGDIMQDSVQSSWPVLSSIPSVALALALALI